MEKNEAIAKVVRLYKKIVSHADEFNTEASERFGYPVKFNFDLSSYYAGVLIDATSNNILDNFGVAGPQIFKDICLHFDIVASDYQELYETLDFKYNHLQGGSNGYVAPFKILVDTTTGEMHLLDAEEQKKHTRERYLKQHPEFDADEYRQQWAEYDEEQAKEQAEEQKERDEYDAKIAARAKEHMQEILKAYNEETE